VFTGSDTDTVGFQLFPDGSVTESIIWCGGLFNEPEDVSSRIRMALVELEESIRLTKG
jgi:hypothetical protein